MAEEIPDNRFKSEVIHLLATVITKVDSLEEKVDGNSREINLLQSEVRVLGGQFQDVANVVKRDNQRLISLEHRVDVLEQKPQ